MDQHTFAILDVETTGGSPRFHRVIEVGVLRVEHGEVVHSYQSLLNPGTSIPQSITRLTGITDSDVKGAPLFDDIKDELISILEGAIFVAHNCSFDYGFIKQEFNRSGFGFAMESLCSVQLSRRLFPKFRHHNLSAIIERFNLSIANRHRALDDARAVWDFFQLLPDRIGASAVQAALARTIKPVVPGKRPKTTSPILEPVYVYEE